MILILILVCSNMLFSSEAIIDSAKVKDPSTAWKLALIPSVGQIYNKDYHKVVGFWLLESYSIYKFNDYNKDNKLANRNTYAWWIAGLYIMSIIDAYVDAHLSTFPVEVESNHMKVK